MVASRVPGWVRWAVSMFVTLVLISEEARSEPTGTSTNGRDGGPSPPTNPRDAGLLAFSAARTPPPLVTADYLEIKLNYKKGQFSVIGLKRGTFKKGPTRIKRFHGQYAVLLWSGPTLLDLVRFNFPLVAGVDGTDALNEDLDRELAAGASSRITVAVPFDSRITRLCILDVKRNTQTPVSLEAFLPPTDLPVVPNLRTVMFRPLPKPSTDKLPDPAPRPTKARRRRGRRSPAR